MGLTLSQTQIQSTPSPEYNDITLLLDLYPELNWGPTLAANPNMSLDRINKAYQDELSWAFPYDVFERQHVYRAGEFVGRNPNISRNEIDEPIRTNRGIYVASNPKLTIQDARTILASQPVRIDEIGYVVKDIAANKAFTMEDLTKIFNLTLFNQPDEVISTLNYSGTDKQIFDSIRVGIGEGVSLNPNFRSQFRDQYPNLPYNDFLLASNPGTTLQDIDKYQLYHWNTAYNPNVTRAIMDGRTDWSEIVNNPNDYVKHLFSRIQNQEDLSKFITHSLLANAPIDTDYVIHHFQNLEKYHGDLNNDPRIYIDAETGHLASNPNLTWRHVQDLFSDALNRGIDIYADNMDTTSIYYRFSELLGSHMKTIRGYRVPDTLEFKDLLKLGLRNHFNKLIENGYTNDEAGIIIRKMLEQVQPV